MSVHTILGIFICRDYSKVVCFFFDHFVIKGASQEGKKRNKRLFWRNDKNKKNKKKT